MNEGLYHIVLVLSILLCPIFSQIVKNSSLIFVIDNTHSMAAEVKNVLRSADGLFDAVYNSNKSEIDNVVIVTFNDPDFELRITTNKKEDFKKSLLNLDIGGGDDCPEMAMSGIELGLQSGGPYSYMFVFTDARAKDVHKYERVKNLALELNTKITFLVTKMFCPNETNIDFSAFVKLAHDTGGEFFFLNKKNIPQIMKYVMKLVDNRKVEIFKREFNGNDKVVVPLDPSIDNVIMSVNGGAPKVDVTDKDNSTVNTETITNITNVKIISWNNTNPGDYTIEINSTTNTLLTMHGSTKISFSYGFSVIKPHNFNETTNRPVADQKSYILLKLNTEGENINLQRLHIVDLKDNVLLDKLTFVAEQDQYYISEPINFPKDTFKIVIVAEDETMKDIITRASLPIEPQKVLPGTMKNEAPTVTILGETKVTTSVGNPLQLKCRATGYPKPEIDDVDFYGKSTTVSTVREEYEFLSVLNIEKVEKSNTYICKASNIINSDEKSVEVGTGDRFAVVKISKDKQIEYNKEEKIYCKVNADPPAKVIWYLNGNEIKAGDDFDISPDTSTLTIKKMKPNYKGTVLCEVRNSVKRLMYSIKLSLSKTAVEGPKIDKRITEIFVKRGSNAIVSCRILKGTPKPIIKWSFKSKNNDTFYDIKEYKEDIPIESVSNNDAGTYKCVATNVIAEDSHVLDLIIEYAPVVLGQNNVTIIQEIGQDILITCEIKGEPAPTINWIFNGLMILNLEPYQIDNYNTLSFKASVKNMGQYSCEGVNKLGSVKKIAKISVFEKPRLTKNSTVETRNIELGEPLYLICPVKGYPTPKIHWSFVSLDGKQRNISSNGQIQIPEVTMNDDGYYTCIVNDYGSEIKYLYEVNVKEPIKRKPREIEAIEGDKYLRIPCKSAAELNSTITWYKNDAPIIIAYEWHSMDSDGSLIIKKVRNTTAGIYNCITRDRSEVLETFKVKVTKYPNLRQSYTIEYFLEDKNATIHCKVAQPTTTDIRWYKTKNLVGFGKSLTWYPYKKDLRGKYVCRVDNGFQYKNDGVDVKTGSMPKFQFDTHTPVENVPFDQEGYLACVHSGLPKTEVLWWKNDIRMNYNDMTYSIQNKVSDIGKYKCVAKNKFGNISREFTVTANDCLLNIEKDFDRYHPLILTNTFKLPDFFIKDGHLAIPIGTTVQFFCNGTFNKFPEQTVKAICREGTTFEINKELVDYRTLKCKEALQIVTNSVERTENCKGTLHQIGIQPVFDFIELYKICCDRSRRSLYTEHIIRPWAAGVRATGMQTEKWFHSDMLNYNQNEIYDCKRQSDNISAVLGRSLSGNEDECFIARQLINEKDVPPGFPQILTYSYLNVIPHWNSDAAGYWNDLEKKIRENAKQRIERRNIIVTTGVNYDVLKGQSQINITDEAGNSIKVPTFLWKVISDTYTSSSVVIVQINVPPSLIDNITTYQVCDSKCDEIPWITEEIDEKYLKSGFMLCCDITQFEKIFQFTNISQGRKWLLRRFEN